MAEAKSVYYCKLAVAGEGEAVSRLLETAARTRAAVEALQAWIEENGHGKDISLGPVAYSTGLITFRCTEKMATLLDAGVVEGITKIAPAAAVKAA